MVAVLFLVFNRPEHTRAVLDRIRRAAPPRLYVHCDGPRPDKPGEADKVARVRDLIEHEVDWDCQITRIYRDGNLGLREGVYDALNRFFDTEPSGIVLEDDCVPDSSFFEVCAALLEYYKNDDSIMHIGGSNLLENRMRRQAESYVFTRFSFVWGWASWRRAWQKMSINLEGLEEFANSPAMRRFLPNPLARWYMVDKFRVTQRRENRSWAYAWFYSILKNDGICIVTAVNMVENVGVGDAQATNTSGKTDRRKRKARPLSLPLVHPTERRINPILDQLFFYTSQKNFFTLILFRIKRIVGWRARV